MDLPVRLVTGAITEPAILVDGFARVDNCLVLSHWPGNTTPEALRHELSTGSALAFAALDEAERKRLAGDARSIVNNHYDTDGVLSLFAVRFPKLALERADRLLRIAASGDFYAVPDENAFIVETIIAKLADPDVSPLDLRSGLDDSGTSQIAVDFLMGALPAIIDGDIEPHRALFEPRLEAVRADRATLAAATRQEHADARLTTWAIEAEQPCEPMRHALFADTDSDRVLALTVTPRGTSARLVISTRSWFAIPGQTWSPRPDLGRIATELNRRADTNPAGEFAWRAQPRTSASPELWFGAASDAQFADRTNVLAPGPLGPDAILEVLLPALRAR